MNKIKQTIDARLIKASAHSWAGLKATWSDEQAFRMEAVLGLILLPAVFWLGDSLVDYLLLFSSMVLVLIVEILNTAIETVVDRVGTEQSPLSKKAKDQGSAAVFVAMMFFVVVWLSMLAQKLGFWFD